MGNALSNTNHLNRNKNLENFVDSPKNQKWLLKRMTPAEKQEAANLVKRCWCESCFIYGLPLAGAVYALNLRVFIYPLARVSTGEDFWSFLKRITMRYKFPSAVMFFSQTGILSVYFSNSCYAPALSKYYEKYRELAKTVDPAEIDFTKPKEVALTPKDPMFYVQNKQMVFDPRLRFTMCPEIDGKLACRRD